MVVIKNRVYPRMSQNVNRKLAVPGRSPLCALVAFGILWASSLFAASGRNELEFEVNAALMSRDVMALARCFNINGTDEATRESITKILNQILSWPGHQVTTSEREGGGSVEIAKSGGSFTLNGDWRFQVHIHEKNRPERGFVFPAGYSHGECLILLTVRKE